MKKNSKQNSLNSHENSSKKGENSSGLKFNDETLSLLKKGKNLLAFSYSSDSTALFYALVKMGVCFDLAMINYKMRAQSDEEERSARVLAREFDKKIFIKCAPKFDKDFQHQARAFRYEFFDALCAEFGYTNLLVAHHLNDKFEWFLRQFGRGAGFVELLGMKECEKRANFTLIRPLLNTPKAEILAFLEENQIKFFNDESNEDEKYERNFIRKHFATPFLQRFGAGVKKSFAYLEKDTQGLCASEIAEFKGILLCAKNESLIAKAIKQKGVVLSAKQRKEMMKGDSVVSGRIGVVFMGERALIFEYEKCEKIPKKFKENYRKARIAKLLRPYLYNHNIAEKNLLEFLAL